MSRKDPSKKTSGEQSQAAAQTGSSNRAGNERREATPMEVKEYEDQRQQKPFKKWLADLKDVHGRARIQAAITRLEAGNTSSLEPVKGHSPLMEIKFEGKGPGYRVYCAHDGEKLIILLAGGIKTSQTKDIGKAWDRWNDYQKRKDSKAKGSSTVE